MEKREILPYLNVNVVVLALNFYKGSFQFHHKSFTHAPVLWKNIKGREPWPHPPGEGESRHLAEETWEPLEDP